ncbi:MAG TPA: hypothetical protein VL051_08955 [Burkholderiaceae bacterium]|nr:hypothetical protein [Burkholderiaceae bacterium]
MSVLLHHKDALIATSWPAPNVISMAWNLLSFDAKFRRDCIPDDTTSQRAAAGADVSAAAYRRTY